MTNTILDRPEASTGQAAPIEAGAAASPEAASNAALRERLLLGLRGVGVMAVTAAGIEIVARALRPMPSPEAVLLLAVAWSTYRWGPAAGLAGAAAAALWALLGLSGSEGAVGASFALIALAGPAVALMVGIQRERTKRVAGESAARMTSDWIGEVVDEVDAILWEADLEAWKYTYVSEGAERMLGYPLSRWLGSVDFWVGLIHLEDRERTLRECMEASGRGADHELEYRLLAADGRVLWVRDIVHVAGEKNGKAKHLRGVIVDVTRQKRQERLRAGQQEILELVAAGAPADRVLDRLALCVEEQIPEARCAVTRVDGAGERLVIVSAPSLSSATGSPIPGRAMAMGRGSCGAAAFRRQRVVSEDVWTDPLWGDCREIAKDLGLRSAWSQPVFAPGGEILGTICVMKAAPSAPGDAEALILESAATLAGIAIERHRSDEGMRQSLSLLKATLESTADGILVVDKNGKIVSFNQKFLDLWRIPPEIVESRDDDKAIAFVLDQLVDSTRFLDKIRDLYSSPETESFDVLEFKDGRVFERLSRPQRVGDQCVGRVWSFRDVSDRKRAEEALLEREEQLRHAQKMEAVGRLAGGVAHDFNNLLTAITGYSDLALRELSGNDPVCERIREIRRASASATALTRQLLAFSRKQVLQLQVLNLNRVVEETTNLLRRTLGEDVELVIGAAEPIGQVRADRGQIEQVLVNLAVNARDAMPQGGKLIIETAEVHLDEPYARRHTGVRPGPYVMISVSDTGIGMDEETRGHIFEPFFTTKEIGRGTGLGLATVYGIVKQSGGNIWVYSEPRRGTTFKIYLPRVEEGRVEEHETTAPVEMPEGSGTVLLVEDDDAVRALVALILADCGYSVVEACDGREGLKLFETHQGPIDLIVTDIVMPGMSGREMAERILASHPGMKILFVSGYTRTAVQHHGLLESGSNFLQKPFSPRELARKVGTLMSAPEEPRPVS